MNFSFSVMSGLFDEELAKCRAWGIPVADDVILERGMSHDRSFIASTYEMTDGSFHIKVSVMFNRVFRKRDIKIRAFRNVLMHELIHTCPGCMNHGKEWKRWIKWLDSEKGYEISWKPYSEKMSYCREFPF